jgi:hypothetical protein
MTTGGGSWRFLLDQNFPDPPGFDPQQMDHRVSYTHLRVHAAELARVSTPDWMIYLAAAAGGFDGLVTQDLSQLELDTEMIALTISKISVITWQKGGDDPVALWGQLMAYMPQVVRRLDRSDPRVVTLPTARLGSANLHKPGDIARSRKRRDAKSFPERRAEALALMRREVKARGARHLEYLLVDQ